MSAVLFRNLQDEVQGLFGDAGQVDFSERSILFVDQAVSIVKHILESPQVSQSIHNMLNIINSIK